MFQFFKTANMKKRLSLIKQCRWYVMPVLLLLHVVLICPPAVLAQATPETVSGTILGPDGKPLSSATVKLKNAAISVKTDEAGKFSIAAAKNSTLVISYVGFVTQEIPVNNRSMIEINLMADDKALGDVVVVGYGTQKKANLTGAVSTVSSKTIENRPVSTLANALQGVTPGLIVTRVTGTPGDEGIGIQIRGATSANGNVNPLLVIDGVTSPGVGLQSLNPNDVESISVLKDAAAASIYGAQAAGGVILVTTKKGRSGKTVFEYSNLFGIDWALNVPERLPSWEEATLSNLARKNAGTTPEYTDQEIQWLKDGTNQYSINPLDTNQYLYYYTGDFTKDILRDRTNMQTHNISARGGNEKLNFFTSFGYYDKQGIFKIGPDQNNRYNIRINLASQLNKYLSMDARLSYTKLDQEAPQRISSGTNSNFHVIYRNSRTRYPIFTPEGRLNSLASNTYATLKEGGYDNYTRGFYDGVFNFKLANFVKGLEFRAVYGTQFHNSGRARFVRTVPLYNRTGIASYLFPTSSYTLRDEEERTSNLQFLGDYDFSLNRKNRFHILAGYQFEDLRETFFETRTSSLVNNDLPSLGLGDDRTKTNAQGVASRAFKSVFGRLNYNFDERFLFEAAVRLDESSQLAPGLRRKLFPAASAGWNLHREQWFEKGLPFFSEFKLRGSWGTLGNAQGLGNYDYLPLLDRGANVVLGTPETRNSYFFQSTVPATDLSWETIETYNGGLDIGLFKNKLQFSGDYYVKYNRNMLTPSQLPGTFGVGTPRKNNGELKSWGWETELRYRDRIGKNLNFSIAVNVSDNQNELNKYAGRKTIPEGLTSLLEGYPLGSYWGFQTAGIFTSADEVTKWAFQDSRTGVGDVKYMDLNGDGRINIGKGTVEDHGDMIFLGTNQPRYTFGFTLNLEWKGIDFTMFLQGVGKRNFMPSRESLIPFQQTFIQGLAIARDYWTPENPNALFPRLYLAGDHNYRTSDRWVLNGRYMRVKNLQLGYTLPQKWMNKVKLSRARIYFSGQDILTVSSLGGFKGYYDPENRNDISADYPFFATAAFGINLTF